MSVRIRMQTSFSSTDYEIGGFLFFFFLHGATCRSPLHNCYSSPFHTDPQMADFWYLSHFVLRRKTRICLRSTKWYWMPLPAGNVNLKSQELNILNKWSVFSRTVLVSISILINGNLSGYSLTGKGMKRRNNLSAGGDSQHTSQVWPAQTVFQKRCSNFHQRQQIRTPFSVRKDMIKLVL